MDDKQRSLGQLETLPDAADLLLGFCLRRPSNRLLDPSCGQGDFLQRAALWRGWLADSPTDLSSDGLWGVDWDEDTAVTARAALPQATIITHNFFTLEPDKPFDAIIGRPPHIRADRIGRLYRGAGKQLKIGWNSNEQPPETTRPKTTRLKTTRLKTTRLETKKLIPRHLWQSLSHRSGLYAYFILHSLAFLREGGRLGFIVPNSWLDAAYGADLKRFLLAHFRLVALIESTAERWLPQSNLNACLVVLEKCSDPNRRAANWARLAVLKRPLSHFIPFPPDNPRRLLAVERLVPRLLPSADRRADDFDVRVLPQWQLDAAAKWGVILHAPDALRKRQEQGQLPSLGSWAVIRRGFTTGANRFFYLDQDTIETWGIEAKFRRPFLKTLQNADKLQVDETDSRAEMLWLPPGTDWQQSAAVSAYIAWGEAQGFHRRAACAARHPWYSLTPQPPAHILLPKSIRQRHTAALLAKDLPVDQHIYRISLADGTPPLAAAALLNSAWFALQCELYGRTNFGEGLLWLAQYELAAILLPDPRQLTPAQAAELTRCFEPLTQRPIGDTLAELDKPDRQALDTAVFDILNLTAAERTAVIRQLRTRVQERLQG